MQKYIQRYNHFSIMVNNFGGEKKAPTFREKCFSPQWDALKELKICLQSGTKITDNNQ